MKQSMLQCFAMWRESNQPCHATIQRMGTYGNLWEPMGISRRAMFRNVLQTSKKRWLLVGVLDLPKNETDSV